MVLKLQSAEIDNAKSNGHRLYISKHTNWVICNTLLNTKPKNRNEVQSMKYQILNEVKNIYRRRTRNITKNMSFLNKKNVINRQQKEGKKNNNNKYESKENH